VEYENDGIIQGVLSYAGRYMDFSDLEGKVREVEESYFK